MKVKASFLADEMEQRYGAHLNHGVEKNRRPRGQNILTIRPATIVGEVDGGSAHPIEYRRGHEHFALDLREGRLRFDGAAFDVLEAEIRSFLHSENLITPADVQGGYATPREAVLANNWPEPNEARSRFRFAINEGPDKDAIYRGNCTSLEGRAFFIDTDEHSTAAARFFDCEFSHPDAVACGPIRCVASRGAPLPHRPVTKRLLQVR